MIRFERQSVIMGVTSGPGRPEVEAELPRRDQLPNDNYRANATFKVFLKEVSEVPRRGPQLFVSRANAGLVVYLFENEVPEIQEGSVRIGEPEFDLDIFVQMRGHSLDSFRPTLRFFESAGSRIPYLGPTGLILLKQDSWREKDQRDTQAMREAIQAEQASKQP